MSDPASADSSWRDVRVEHRRRPWWRWQLPVHSPLTARALGAGWSVVFGGGDPRDALRSQLAVGYHAEQVILCESGTDALTRAIGVACSRFGENAIVALPAYGCYDLATAAVGARRPVVLYDLDPTTLGPEPGSLSEALRAGANVVVCAALYGMPIDWRMVDELAGAAGAVVIEDAAQGQGGSWKGRPLGSLGEFSVLSFGRGKGWTGGRGGALLRRGVERGGGGGKGAVVDGGGWAAGEWAGCERVGGDRTGGERTGGEPVGGDRVSNLAALLPATVQWVFGRPWCYGLPASIPWLGLGETRYRDPAPGGALAPSAAALLLAGRGEALAGAVARHMVAEYLLDQLPPRGRIFPIEVVADGVSGYLRLPLRVPGVGAALAGSVWARRLGIARGYPTPLAALEPLARLLVCRRWPWPGAEELVRDLITLPTHTLLSRRDRERLVHFLGRGAPTLPDPRELEPIPR